MAVVERLTKQNQDLEEKLRQKNAAMGTQEEDQEGTSVERRDREGPEGSKAPSRPERQDLSYPSITDTTPPYIVADVDDEGMDGPYDERP